MDAARVRSRWPPARLSGCFSLGRTEPPQRHYVLGGERVQEAPAGAARPRRPHVGVRRLRLASYLEAPFLVVRHGPTRSPTPSSTAGASRSAAGSTARSPAPGGRPSIRAVDVAPWPAREQYDYLVQLHVERFEGLAPEDPPRSRGRSRCGSLGDPPPAGRGGARPGRTEHRERGWRVGDYAGLVRSLDAGLAERADRGAGGHPFGTRRFAGRASLTAAQIASTGTRHPNPFRRYRMDVLTWLLVGLVAGVLASFVMGGIGYGIVGDIIVGIVGAFVGGWLFAQAGWSTPFAGVAGVIFVAFIGAVLLLFILSVLRRATVRALLNRRHAYPHRRRKNNPMKKRSLQGTVRCGAAPRGWAGCGASSGWRWRAHGGAADHRVRRRRGARRSRGTRSGRCCGGRGRFRRPPRERRHVAVSSATMEFYRARQWQAAWVGPKQPLAQGLALHETLGRAWEDGLPPARYRHDVATAALDRLADRGEAAALRYARRPPPRRPRRAADGGVQPAGARPHGRHARARPTPGSTTGSTKSRRPRTCC
jgi:uncharacterized membrane protein YeaQ/YmgE (transglycosylase-associated protein family)